MTNRALLLVAFVALPGCFTLSGASKRVALAPTPGAPPSLRGSPGIGLATRIPLGDPQGGQQGDGIAVSSFQPELNGVFKFAERAYGSFDLNFTLGGDTRAARGDLPRNQADLSFGALIGGGYDFQLAKAGGINISAEAGFNFVSVTTTIGAVSAGVSNFLLFAGRIAAAPYFEIKDFRIFGGAVLSSDVWNEANGFASTCSSCTVMDTGRTETRAMVMVGAGARYQVHRMFAVGAEFWLPVTDASVRHPPHLMIALQVGDFDFSRSRRAADPVEKPGAPRPPPVDDFIPPPPPPLPELIPRPVPI